ncbi:MAG: DUF433 domain-containing protein [Cyanobacteria bacterium P01_E01_bin.42]
MKLEDYFTFLNPNDIRLKGTRVGIEIILYEYIYEHRSPEAIFELYPNLKLEQIYATILYFLSDREKITQYMADWLKYCQESERKYEENLPDHAIRFRKLKEEMRIIR